MSERIRNYGCDRVVVGDLVFDKSAAGPTTDKLRVEGSHGIDDKEAPEEIGTSFPCRNNFRRR